LSRVAGQRHAAGDAVPVETNKYNVKSESSRLDFEDILWLRRAATKAGAAQVPPAIAEKLMNAGLLEIGPKPTTLRITEKGRIALSKLG
jgi:hypothetical protein